ncbi:MAG: hypothetical protein FWG81_03270 [Betaproteobacteria bacterium]|nr:hypothetical protein [Betaproteobacteria bacterium]
MGKHSPYERSTFLEYFEHETFVLFVLVVILATVAGRIFWHHSDALELRPERAYARVEAVSKDYRDTKMGEVVVTKLQVSFQDKNGISRQIQVIYNNIPFLFDFYSEEKWLGKEVKIAYGAANPENAILVYNSMVRPLVALALIIICLMLRIYSIAGNSFYSRFRLK